MDAKLVFWTGAFVNMTAVALLAVVGVWQRRRGAIARHRRSMASAGALVGLFLVAYVLKVALLGREDRVGWSGSALWLLRFHELCVACMLLAGSVAATRGLALARTRNATGRPEDPAAPARLTRWHRSAGWVATGAALLGLLSAGAVLHDMYARAGLV